MQPEKDGKESTGSLRRAMVQYHGMREAQRTGSQSIVRGERVAAVHLLQVAEEAAEFSAGDTETAAVLI